MTLHARGEKCLLGGDPGSLLLPGRESIARTDSALSRTLCGPGTPPAQFVSSVFDVPFCST